MSQKKKSTSTKKSTSKKTTSKSKKTSSKSTGKKSSSTAKKTTKKSTSGKKATSSKKTTTKKPTAKKPKKKSPKVVKARIMSYRRSKRQQTTNQAIAKILDDYNHKALIGKKFTLEFPDSDASLSGTVIAVHGQDKNKQVRVRFDSSGMTAHAINHIAEISVK